MQHLEPKLGAKCSNIIFEYLLNGDDYMPFIFYDIYKLKNKITDWDFVMHWTIVHDKLQTQERITLINLSAEKYIE